MPRGIPKNAPGAGRPTLKTDTTIEILLKNRRIGLSHKTCADLAHIDVTTLYNWLKDDRDFSIKWNDAGSQMVRQLHLDLCKKEPWKIAKTLEPTIYRDRLEQEITGKDGEPLKLIVEDLRIGEQDGKEEIKK